MNAKQHFDSKQYWVVSRERQERIAGFATYDLALAAWHALGGGDSDFAVRSGDDPTWARRPETTDRGLYLTALRAAGEWRRKEIGATVTSLIKGEDGLGSLDALTRAVTTSLRGLGLAPER